MVKNCSPKIESHLKNMKGSFAATSLLGKTKPRSMIMTNILMKLILFPLRIRPKSKQDVLAKEIKALANRVFLRNLSD
jgi:hypothetical protein